MNHANTVYCIVVTYNAEKWIEQCLDSVIGSSIDCSIVVIDNQSADHTSEIIKSRYPSVRLIQNNENMGFGKANNMAIKLAYHEGADYVFLLNQDAWVKAETIGQLVQKHRQHPEYGILSPLHLFNAEQLDRKFKSYLGVSRGNEIIKNPASGEDSIIQVRFVNAAMWLMSRRCIETVGLFAPIFYQYGEDLNYAHRCKFHNIKIGIYPKAIGFHEREQSTPRETDVPLSKLLARDKHYCLGVLLNLKHRYIRQWFFLLFNSIKEFFKSIVWLKFKTIRVIANRISFIARYSELKDQRRKMKSKGAFLDQA